jgi:LmbE family N-acetylglucosaminyl deacetylase
MKLDVLAIGSHPDDVELGCGGTLALLASQGRQVGIVHLTRGERGTRGTPEQRKDEAERATSTSMCSTCTTPYRTRSRPCSPARSWLPSRCMS